MDKSSFDSDGEARDRAHELFATGASATQVAAALGVAVTIVYRWRTSYLIASGKGAEVSDDTRAELLAARQRIEDLQDQLRDAHAEVERLESQLQYALRANDILRDRQRDREP